MEKKAVAKIMPTLLLIGILTLALNVELAMGTGPDMLACGEPDSQREVSIAVNPRKPSNIVVGFNDFSTAPPRPRASFAYSTDSGSHWTYGGPLPKGSLQDEPYCDPWLAFDSQGYLYYVALSHGANNEVFVSVGAPNPDGDVGPLGFGSPSIVDGGAQPNDKPAIAVDKTGGTYDGNIYVAWRRDPGARLWFRRGRRNPGTTTIRWDPAQQVGPDAGCSGAQVAVGPNGEVYVAYLRYSDAQLFSYSPDGGNTFPSAQKNIVVSSVTPVDCLVTPDSWARHNSFPTLGVSPVTGTIFVAWADKRNGDDDILLSKSPDQGNHWTAPVRVNFDPLGNGKDQWSPALTVDSRGYLNVIFYDRRNDPLNKLTMLYVATSYDEGSTFLNCPLSDTATNPDAFLNGAGCPGPSGCLGDYEGIDSVGTWTYAAWSDGRNCNPSPRDYNSDIYFESFQDPLSIRFPILIGASLRLIGFIPLIPPSTHSLTSTKSVTLSMQVLPIEGFDENVNLTAVGVPPGASYNFEPASGVPPFNTTLTIKITDATEGTYPITIVASYASGEATLPIELVITSKPYILPEATMANPGANITLEGEGFTPSSLYGVYFDGKLIKTDLTDPAGTIFTTIVIPKNATDGAHSIVVEDEIGKKASTTVTTPIGVEEEAPETLVGDVNKDLKVGTSDLIILSKAYGSTPDSANWSPWCDFNLDNKVDIFELFDLSKNFGKTAP